MADENDIRRMLEETLDDFSSDHSEYVPNSDLSDSSGIAETSANNSGPRETINMLSGVAETSSNFVPTEPLNLLSVKVSKKRSRNPEKHKKTIRKRKRQMGKEYVSSTGKLIKQKECDLHPCRCPKKCSSIISNNRKKGIFENFYKLDSQAKAAFVSSQIENKTVKRTYGPKNSESRRKFTRVYRLTDENGQDKVVCKKFFQDTLQVCDGSINNMIKSKSLTGTPTIDLRGKHTPHNKTSDEDEAYVEQFIKKFPSYESHYCRRDSQRKYLSPTLNVSIMFRMYQSECRDNSKTPLSIYMFRQIFNTKFNLSFHPSLKDTCRICDEFKVKNSPSEDEKNNHESHLKAVEDINRFKKEDVEEARSSNGTTHVLVFDLQKTLPTPDLSTGIAYYKRQYWTYNLGIHDEATDTGHMYVWGEHIASRGAQEVASCLFKHVTTKLPLSTKKITSYSDSCGGQNRNIKVTLLLSYILQKVGDINEINLQFFIPGHSFSSCDRDFGIIEREKKYHEHIYHPNDWINVIKSAKKKEPKFQVLEMTAGDFYSSKSLENDIVNRKQTKDKVKVEWLKMRWIQLRKENPKTIFFKYDLEPSSPFHELDIAKKLNRGRPGRSFMEELEHLYPNGRPITKEKKKDLMTLISFIPPIYHSFYENLPADETVQDFGLECDIEDLGENAP